MLTMRVAVRTTIAMVAFYVVVWIMVEAVVRAVR
jgi:hypothetical protein